ncbi:MAG: hypothetical protein Q8P39_03805 [Candidatus Yanofskybacteria bacterium]|nr:hypothetical protein [Candidatus Yanofskybacteria bacterium]
MKTILFALFAFAGLLSLQGVLAQDISFPVAELGNCGSEQECRAYCDDPTHLEQCLDFGEHNGLLSPEEAAHARSFAAIGEGPGQCTSRSSCEAYCDTLANLEECLSFAEQHGIIPPSELAEAKQVLKAQQAGIPMPGNCQNRDQCEAYCENPSHAEECVHFAVAAGFIPPEEAEIAKQMAGFMARGEMPGSCNNEKSCKAYCSDPSHSEECTAFFLKAGVMTPEEAEMFRKTGGRGPGGCQDRNECESFCNNPANQQTCFEFGKEHGLISDEELANIEKGTRRFQEGMESAPAEVVACLESSLGSKTIQKLKSGQLTPTPKLGESMQSCFEEFTPKGPGGCSSEEECKAYCADPSHGDECGFSPQEGQEFHGPQGDMSFPGSQGPEAECIMRILGETPGPPSPEQEEQMKEECFPEPPPHQEAYPSEEQRDYNYETRGETPSQDYSRDEYFPEEYKEDTSSEEQENTEEPSSSQLQGFLLEAARPLLQLFNKGN